MKFDHNVICDICGFEFRRSEVTRITEKYNQAFGLVVCKDDRDILNMQDTPFRHRKEKTVNPLFVRPESDPTYAIITTSAEIEGGDITVDLGTTAASAPLNLKLDSISSSGLRFTWMPPLSLGNGRMTGWKIERESPVGGGFSTLTANTLSVDLSYLDTTVVTGTAYGYRVSAVTTYGAGTASTTLGVTA